MMKYQALLFFTLSKDTPFCNFGIMDMDTNVRHTPKRNNQKKTYLRQPGDAPLNAEQLLSKFLLRCKQMSACRHSGNPLRTLFMSMPLVYVQAC